jgi:hypothetical protein
MAMHTDLGKFGIDAKTRSQEERRALASRGRPRWKKDGAPGSRMQAENIRTAVQEKDGTPRRRKNGLQGETLARDAKKLAAEAKRALGKLNAGPSRKYGPPDGRKRLET